MSDTLDFKINGNKNMDILPGVHGSFKAQQKNLFSGGVTFTVLSDYGEMFFQCLPGHDFEIWFSKYNMHHTASLSAEANSPSMETMHLLEGNISFLPEGIRGPVAMKSSHWQMMSLPYVKNEVTLPAGTRLTTLDIHYSPEYLQRLAPHFSELDQFLNKSAAGKSATLISKPVPIPHRVKSLIGNFFDSRSSLSGQSLFLERHMLDWIASELESSATSAIHTPKVTAHEHTQMMDICQHMMLNLGQPLSISYLAKMTYMSEYKFKCTFKSVFNLPVHKFLMEERLKLAKVMIEEGSHSLQDIATACGYDTYSAFSKEFSKKFGWSPMFFQKK